MQWRRVGIAAVLGVSGLLWASLGLAFTVEQIRIVGTGRIEDATVRNYLPISVGDELDTKASQRAIQVLYETGLFKDVRLEREDGRLIVRVQEKPVITEIEFKGVAALEEKKLRKGFTSLGLEERRMFSRSSLRRATLELERQYHSLGYYAVKVNAEVVEVGTDGVRLVFRVEEGGRAKISQIQIVGNKSFDSTALKQNFTLTDSAAFAFLSDSDKYARQRLMGDLESLRSFYMDRGYLQFKIASIQVQLSPDRRHVFITINVEEGAQYRVAEIHFSGNTVVDKKKLRPLVTLASGELFSRSKVQKTVDNIANRLGSEGFAFANISPRPHINQEAHTVDLTLRVDPGRRVYVRRMEIQGNDRTQDRVVRREFRQLEGALYQLGKIQRSKERVNRLDYFQKINLGTQSVQGENGLIDLDLDLQERSTGQFSLGAGFSNVQGVIFNGSIRQKNLFGRGERISLQADIGGVSQRFNLSFTEPYFTVNGITLGGDVFFTDRNTARLSTIRFSQDRIGLAGRLGFPLTEFWRDSVRLAFERTDTKTGTLDLGGAEDPFLRPLNTIKLRDTLTYDSRNATVFPREGWKNQLSLEFTLPGGDTRYYKLGIESQVYIPLLDQSTFKLGGEFGRLNGYAGRNVPFFEHFFLGGARSVRGFKVFTLGPEDNNGNPVGGVTKLQGNAEFIFPLPGVGAKRRMRGMFFTDTGWVYGPGETIDPAELRASVGVGFQWMAPVGPLEINFAIPVIKEPDDRTQQLQFNLGRRF